MPKNEREIAAAVTLETTTTEKEAARTCAPESTRATQELSQYQITGNRRRK